MRSYIFACLILFYVLGCPKSVVEYLGRYTHKIAISNNRIQSIDDQNVTFSYKDYRQNGFKKQMTLTHAEFIRRFALHILPKRFVKIRHYGFLSSTWKREKLKILQEKLKVKLLEKVEKKAFLPKCPCCKTGNLHRIAVFDQRGPPPEASGWYLGIAKVLPIAIGTPKINFMGNGFYAQSRSLE